MEREAQDDAAPADADSKDEEIRKLRAKRNELADKNAKLLVLINDLKEAFEEETSVKCFIGSLRFCYLMRRVREATR